MDKNYQKLENLLFSSDPANMKLALELAKSQGNQDILELYEQMKEIHQFYLDIPLEKYPKELSGMMTYFSQHGLKFFKNYDVKQIPKEHQVLAPYVNFFGIWYTSFHNLPEGLGMFENIESIRVDGGPITSIRDEVWSLPKLKNMKMSIAKNIVWEDNVELAQNLEHLELEGKVHPNLPPKLTELKSLKSLRIYALGNPKDAKPLEDFLWNCKQLEVLDFFGKTIPQPLDDEIGQLINLKKLVVDRTNWAALPKSLLEMKALETLVLRKMIKLKELPDWFKQLPIKELQITACKIKNAFEILKEMPQLKSLAISGNTQKKIDEPKWQAEFSHLKLDIY